jgi:hypothetical protein
MRSWRRCAARCSTGGHGRCDGPSEVQIAVTVCQRCRQGWQEGAGAQVAIEPAAVERAMCDAQHIGSLDGVAPERAHQDIPPSVVRLVWRRDGGRCRVPGCRSARGLEIHHLVHRADGGIHDASNLALLCSACHLAHHRGALTISGTADHLEVLRPAQAPRMGARHDGALGESSTAAILAVRADAREDACDVAPENADGLPGNAMRPITASAAEAGAHVDAPGAGPIPAARAPSRSRFEAAILHTQARSALTGLGWKPAIAHAAVDAAAAALGLEVTLERLIFESLRRCPVSKT